MILYKYFLFSIKYFYAILNWYDYYEEKYLEKLKMIRLHCHICLNTYIHFGLFLKDCV